MSRVAPPAGIDWYDVDFPEVVALRAEAMGHEIRANDVPADLTDPGWLDAVRRLITRLAAHSTAISRRGTTVLRYRFRA
jgi:hypothetical protein